MNFDFIFPSKRRFYHKDYFTKKNIMVLGNEASKVYNNAAMLFFCMLFLMFTAMMPTVIKYLFKLVHFLPFSLGYDFSSGNEFVPARTFELLVFS